MLERTPQSGFGADTTDQHDFAPRFQHACKLVECCLRVGHRCHHVLRDHDVERGVGKAEPLGVHHRDAVDVIEPFVGDALLRLAQHRFRNIDSANLA